MGPRGAGLLLTLKGLFTSSREAVLLVYGASFHVLLLSNMWESVPSQAQGPLTGRSVHLLVMESCCIFILGGGGVIWRTSSHSFTVGTKARAGEQ